MKRFLLATVSMVALTSVTRAAEMPVTMPVKGPMYAPAPVATWDGAYFGVQGGVVRRDALFDDVGANPGTTPFPLEGDKTGAAAGLLLGYNWQRGSFVYGLEGDWSWVGAKASTRISTFEPVSFGVNWIGTIRGRAGLAVDSTLFYLTGGAAFGHVKDNVAIVQDTSGAAFFSFAQNQTKVGWVVGTGVEHALAPHWTARAELRYVDFGKTTVDCLPGVGSCPSYRGQFSNSLWLGLLGLNYKFGGDRAADWSHTQAYAPASVPAWAGAHLGFQGGIAQNHAAFEDSDCFFRGCPLIDHRKIGGAFGGLLGYNWQRGSFVYGVEGDWNWINAKWSRLDPNVNGPESRSISFETNWLATARGRVGVALNQTLLYVTGGAAFGHVKNVVEFISQRGDRFDSFAQNQTKIGWTAGVGAEYMLSPHWTARAEFRYVDLGKTNVSCTSATNFAGCVTNGPDGAYRGTFSNTLKLGLVGLAYRF
jgi:outer membrane immunogenic protein